ncbi:molybdopterin-guanine dinucleotide biosynthesis protein B [Desulfallas thermosapovorans]|uniref:Molybdopterin guanine dinucleotide biosynthesis accessory protein MobB n=1 Tax=Desulfallas thermosapovorans DSM 6562 TaxID=1121431 RepID=A0A5S4ZX15_9FIRM|nr:molybdopterin-guanine dinucleotide biosynthesis protein B [Desulfallas thermosapovorans]TYO97233.1 molybdopterin guanine dinucleotide biosynthesis accessory protein MobB [Desulfallas thermosapovorans DSM 6562]
MTNKLELPIISIVGWHNTGKTTFLEKLVAELRSRGIRVGVIKHHRGPFEMDQPGKDTWRLARAGAVCTAIAGPGKIGLVMETEGDPAPGDIAALMGNVDMVFTEGYKSGPYPQLEVRRAGYGEDRPAARAGQLVAVVGKPYPGEEDVPCFDVGDITAVANFILEKFGRK